MRNASAPVPPRRRIVLAEDNRLLSDVLVRLFRREGHEVEAVGDGLSAWEILGKDIRQHDVVVTDHEMPHLTGLELVELLRQADFRGRIVVHSASLTPKERDLYAAFGVTIVVKSARADELLAAVCAPSEGIPCADAADRG
jgi:CheY-like chemotaxis protein